MDIGEGAKLRKLLRKERIWKLWSGSEVITINRGAGGDIGTGEEVTLTFFLLNTMSHAGLHPSFLRFADRIRTVFNT